MHVRLPTASTTSRLTARHVRIASHYSLTTQKIRVVVSAAGGGHGRVVEVEAWGAGADARWLVTDHLGTPRMVVDAASSPLPRKNPKPPRGILIRVKKVVFLACAALLVLTLKHLDGVRFPAARRATLPFKVALLSAREPDRELAVPVEGVRVEQVGDSWHAPRPGGRLHEGQDIFAARGTAVRSAAEGYVVRVGESALGGNTVWVAGAGGRSYYYAHLDSYAPGLTVGDYITTESVLGYVGTTGNAAGTAPHLHFGVYDPGGALDPLPLLRDRPEAAARPAPRKARRTRA